MAKTVVGLVTPEPRKHLPDYISLLIESEDLLARAFDQAIEPTPTDGQVTHRLDMGS